MTVQGVPLGFVDAQCWARDPQTFGKKAQRHALAIEQKESYRWLKSYQAVAAVQKRNPQLTLVSMGDREADIYELFAQAAIEPAGPKLLIRAQHDRQVQDEQARLFEAIRGSRSPAIKSSNCLGRRIVQRARPNWRSALPR
ncbi:MAG: hypothetical protein IPI02_12340 [Sterolibacteriaceae bacterium]|nr:hypothetical protein [Sterolibacteriaceae bacterium]